ncbi:putative phage tail protein [Brevibacillus borstelensis]|uniref:putative phage tail protein n=1 Tax=Brevibacillus borstelensis TaxID=45462 RepID=UPI0030CB3FAF
MERDIRQDMHDYLPDYYAESVVVANLMDVEAAEFERLHVAIRDVTDQYSPETATWSLDRWEAIFGLTQNKYAPLTWDVLEENVATFDELEKYTWNELDVAPFVRQPDVDRRSAIKARMRGTGTATKEMIRSVVESYTNGTVEITEHNDRYAITIKFVSNVGIPPNYESAKAAVLEIIPAHIGVEFTNEYSLWQDVRKTTWGNLANYTWGDVKGGLWNA